MGAEERRDHVEPRDPSGPGDRSQDLEFVDRAQAVPALRLHRGRTEGRHPPEAIRSVLSERCFRRVPGRPDRLEDSSSAGRNLRIGQALRFPFHFVFPRTREDRVGVRVHETGHHDLPRRIELHGSPRMAGQDLGRQADVDDAIPLRVHGPVLDETEFARGLPRPGTRGSSQREEFGRMQDEERCRCRRTFPAGGAHLVRPHGHPSFATPRESDWTMNAFPPAARMASAVTEGRSVKATMLPPPPAPVNFAP